MHPTTQIAENHIRISRSLFNEAMRDTESKTYKKAVQKIALVLASLYLIIAFFLSYTGCSLLLLLGESVFLAALLFWLTVMLPGTRRHSKYKALTVSLRELRCFTRIICLLFQIPEKKLQFHMMIYEAGMKPGICIFSTATTASVFCLIKTGL